MKEYNVSFHITVWGRVLNVPAESEEAALDRIKDYLADRPHTWTRFACSVDAHDADEVTDG